MVNYRLKSIIVFFVKNFPRQLARTELVKLVYLFEYNHTQTFCEGFSGTKFIRHMHGPYASEIIDAVNELCNEGVLSCQEYPTIYGSTGYLYKIKDDELALEYRLDDEQETIGWYIINETRSLGYNDIIEKAYSTPPMVTIVKEEVKWGFKQIGREINMAKKKPLLKFSEEEIEEAKKRLDLSSRGSDEDYYEHYLEQFRKLEPFRRRATSCLLK
ncbi:hypothetical protein MTBGP_09490 [Moorella thermoacetica]|uniref:Panacea domain-containing protein n=1 Tax=Neomoorella thermoacetica TaxID=1525 RepID=UPI0030D12EF4